ncbi:HOTHEAD, embryo sac development arrest 17 [Hibiscus trionum]|uniref:HOTHEAD, embryo sac development arrest 17 n=1 Tax=Hibiscus trionum TaxID=183268 RepID=A0A9W7MAW9_HIBTR|nr:HOTHEAD, embryo sac development arrest 17 [Hibiscus trionum]
MADSVGALKLFICLLLWLNTLSSLQGARDFYEFRYPFIKRASSFSSPSSFSSSNTDEVSFDYIIVGGGTAGCPLAATLSRNFSVLVLERGGVPFSNANVSFLSNFHIALADTSPSSASQPFVSTDGVINARARVLGGGTCINAGFYTRANSDFIKRVGWDARLVNESYPWVERQIVHQPKLAQWQHAVKDGLLDVGVSPYNGFTYDHVYGTKVGGTIFDRFGRRHTAAELLASANPKMLTVLVYATVQKVLFDETGKRPKAMGVMFKDENGNQHQAFLTNSRRSEVILSCGAIGTPQMLMLSGVGPKAELERLNISMVLQNEFVGKGMADNPMNSVFVPMTRPVEQSLIQTVGITKMGVYIEASSGFGQSQDSIRCHHGILSAEIGQLSTLPPKQRTKEAIEAFVKGKKDLPHEAFKGGFILEKIAMPLSTGHLNLVNTNVDDNPSVTFNYFGHPRDLQRCVNGIRMAAEVIQSDRFTNFRKCDKPTMEKLLNMSVRANINLIPKHTNDTKSLEQFCKDTVITIWHYHGGCHVGKVVNHDLKVLGTRRLRIVDGSTFRESPGTNPQGTVLMMGRYMGVKILRRRLGKAAHV